MLVSYGSFEIRFCIASLYVNCKGEVSVSYSAYNNGYGMHWDGDWDSPDVLWYDTEEEAKKHLMNANECVISRGRNIK